MFSAFKLLMAVTSHLGILYPISTNVYFQSICICPAAVTIIKSVQLRSHIGFSSNSI